MFAANLKTTKRKIKRSKRRTTRKMKGGQLPEFKGQLNDAVVSLLDGAGTVEWGRNTMQDRYDSFSKEEKDSIATYQNFSNSTNGFLRDSFNFYSDTPLDNDISMSEAKEAFMDETEYVSKEKLDDIKNLDNLFLHKCPKFTRKTVLIRGTDDFYPEGKGYTSTTKNFGTLFTMIEHGDKFLSVRKKCCINVLIVDENIPYLDLEIEGSKWAYQQEILLPRNLSFAVVGESSYEYRSVVYQVGLKDEFRTGHEYAILESDYQRLDIDNKSLFIDKNTLMFLLKNQRDEMGKLFQCLKNDSPLTEDVAQDMSSIHYALADYTKTNLIFLCTKEKYLEICEYFLVEVKQVLSFVEENNIVKDEYVEKVRQITQQVDGLMAALPSGTLIINSSNYIRI
jgi:hypothetical protein